MSLVVQDPIVGYEKKSKCLNFSIVYIQNGNFECFLYRKMSLGL